MIFLIAFISIVLLFQLGLFFWIRRKRKRDREESIVEKYNIKTPADAFRLLHNPELPEEDLQKIQELYNKDFS